MTPKKGDPVVYESIKYRIQFIQDGFATCKPSFSWETVKISVERLTRDRVAGLWRVSLASGG